MIPTPADRPTRTFILSSSLLSFPFLIATCIVSINSRSWYHDQVIPIPFSYIPLFISIATSSVHLARSKKQDNASPDSIAQAPGPDHLRNLWIFLDIFVALGYLAVLIPVWVIEPNYMDSGEMILESYATCFLIVNMMAHFYLAGRRIIQSLKASQFALSECPNCSYRFVPAEHQVGCHHAARGGYHGVRGEIYLDEEREVGEELRDQSGLRSSNDGSGESGKVSVEV